MSITALTLALFTFMTTLTPVKEHAYYEPEQSTVIRYTAVADAIARRVMQQDMTDPMRLQIGAIMVSLGDAESHWKADVVSCKVGGDNGHAWSAWQVQQPKEKMCASIEDGLDIALGMVKQSLAFCRHLPAENRLQWYTDGGDCSKGDPKRSVWRMKRALDWAKAKNTKALVVLSQEQ